jgi:hypothetical protein
MMKSRPLGVAILGTAGILLGAGCLSSSADDAPSATLDQGTLDPGALVRTQMTSTVGVLLDEIPSSIRDRVAADLAARPNDFWIDRAQRQISLTQYRLVFRNQFYAGQKSTQRFQLPLPPKSVLQITLNGPARRTSIDKHDLVVVDYSLDSTIVTDANSPGTSEVQLAKVGGKWTENFTFPVDPELVFQRTRFACLDEAEFPPQSVDSEEVDSFYDDSCGVEKNLSQTGCHQTELPSMSCTAALQASIGHVSTGVLYTRLAWDPSIADTYRVGPITNPTGANMTPEADEFRVNRVTYRYFPPNDCALVEQCVGAPGWRRLLQFATADRNTGTQALVIGSVDYFNQDGGTTNSDHGVFEYSACHKHYHFMHYGEFSFNNEAQFTHKRGFCLQATNRRANNEVSPLPEPFGDCSFQGVSVGWVDEYKAGLPCQWIDVTNVDTSKKPFTAPLSFHSNPDGFLCEGTPIVDANGNQVWERTSFTTATGQPVDRPACNFWPGWDADNIDTYDATLPTTGNGYVTAACTHNQVGPLRNCELTQQPKLNSCTPGGQMVALCTIPAGSAPQVVRACDASAALGTGIPCTYQDSLANAVVEAGPGTMVTFNCPGAKDATEPGGKYSLYTGAAYNKDATATVTCVPSH